jgi:hypothetical protein
MTPEVLVWLVAGFAALVGLHELTHVLVARWHGHPTVCVAINPLSVAVVFEDTPRPRYWIAQVVLPAVVTWAVCYAWLALGLACFSALQAHAMVENPASYLPALVTLLTALTSGGDIATGLLEARKPLWGEARVRRDFDALRRIPSLVLFTAVGRARWLPVWREVTTGRRARRPGRLPT